MSNYKHSNWYCKPANEAEAREVIERAVASGADNPRGWRGTDWANQAYGVLHGFVSFDFKFAWVDSTEYTIEQVRELFPMPGEREWDGEGLPPVGVEFEFSQNGLSWAERVMLFNDGVTCLMSSKKYPTNRYHYKSDDPFLLFRPIRSERDRWVEQALEHESDTVKDMLESIYDALKSGTLPAPEVE